MFKYIDAKVTIKFNSEIRNYDFLLQVESIFEYRMNSTLKNQNIS
jgi:hypothetical protein